MSQVHTTTLLRDGITAAKAGDKVSARQLLREVTTSDPGNELAWLWLGGVAETPQETISSLQRVLALNPEHVQARKGLQQARLQAGIAEAKGRNKRTARRLLYEVTQQDPQCELAWLWLAGVADTPQDTLDCLQRVLSINPHNEHARKGFHTTRVQLGVSEARAGNHPGARRWLREVVQEDADNEQAWHWLAGVAESPREAVDCLERVLTLNPNNERARETLQWYQTRLNETSTGWQCPLCQEQAPAAHDLCPSCGALLSLDDVHTFLSHDVDRPDRVEEAIQRYEGELAKTPTFAAHFNLGLAYLNLQRWVPAIGHLQEAVELLSEQRALRQQLDTLIEIQADIEKREREALARRKHVFIVDDSPTVRKLVTMTLEKNEYRVSAAVDGNEALERVANEQPDLVLLDITMPGPDGYQVCKTLRSSPATKHIPVIMLSGKDGFFDKIRGRLAGSTAYVTKPFKPDELLRVTAKHCKQVR